MDTLLIYGSYGYTGDLIARRALDVGLEPILAGRSAPKLRTQADDLGCAYRQFELDDVTSNIEDVDVVLHCAGPFVETYEPVVEACLETGTHYLDITGEIGVFEALQRYDENATEAGVMVLPGVGFDVVPTDCLANRLHEQLPEATELVLAFTGIPTMSSGSVRTLIEYIERDTFVRRDGRIDPVASSDRTRRIDFGNGHGPRLTRAFSWGDVSTAYYSTGVPNISVYVPTSRRTLAWLSVKSLLAPALETEPVKAGLRTLADRVAAGPDEHERATTETVVWGEATDGDETASARLRTAETYEYTANAAIEIASRALSGDAPPGYQTPATAYGAALVTDIDGGRWLKAP